MIFLLEAYTSNIESILNKQKGPVINTRLHQCCLRVLLAMLMNSSLLASAATKEQAVKAGFVYNITKYVVWPSYVSDAKQFNLCVFGDAKLGDALIALQGKLVGDKSVVVRRWVKSEKLATCHMVFIAQDETGDSYAVMQEINALPVLTVSDDTGFVGHGGMVGLIQNGPKVGFEVDLKAVKSAGLHMSAQLLKLAITVKGLE
ncbi:MAG: hypothetical protein ACI9T7_001896 [Oleiphilaceae bacterium]